MSFHKKIGSIAASALLLAAAGGFAIQPALAQSNDSDEDEISAPATAGEDSPTKDDGATVDDGKTSDDDAKTDDDAVENSAGGATSQLMSEPVSDEPASDEPADEPANDEPTPSPEPEPTPDDGAKDDGALTE